MSVQNEITRIQTSRNKIRTKMVELGLSQGTDQLDKLAADIALIENNGSVSAKVQEGDTYTIPKGYHNGSGTVSGVSGGGNYTLQSKSVTPTKSQQNVTPSSGYYGLSDVTVNPIPENFQDVTPVTATAADVLSTKIIVDKSGKTIAGSMANNGAVAKKLSATESSVSIAKGYHSGLGTVSVDLESKSVTPTKSSQTLKATTGKLISSFTVNPIPAEYIITSDANALEGEILADKTAYVDGEKVTGTMPNNGSVSNLIDGLSTSSVTIPSGYTTGGTVSLTTDIEDALSAI